MALNIKSRETERVVRELAKRTGLSITEAVHQAAIEKLRAIDGDYKARVERLTPEQMAKLRRIEAICREATALPAIDTRSPEEIVGYDALLVETGAALVDFDGNQSRMAFEAHCRFGKGNHPAGLNLGDCASYALAKSLDAPLLFKGNDFARTDVRRALS